MIDKIEEHEKICKNLHELYVKKNADYGDSVGDTFKKYGLISFLVRMEDKLNRVRTLNKQSAQVVDEKIEDTLLDLANYAMLAVIELRNENESNKIPQHIVSVTYPSDYQLPPEPYKITCTTNAEIHD